jgi:predicted nucleotidyltransferase
VENFVIYFGRKKEENARSSRKTAQGIETGIRPHLRRAIEGRLFVRLLRAGEARPDSDIDVLMVLKGDFDYIEMLKCSDDFAASYCLEKNVVISRAFVSEKEFKEKLSPFLINVRREAVAV